MPIISQEEPDFKNTIFSNPYYQSESSESSASDEGDNEEDPFEDEDQDEDELEEKDEKILEQSGIIDPQPSVGTDIKLSRILKKSGVSVEDAAYTIGSIMRDGMSDSSKLRAAEIALDLHGVRNKEGNVQKQPIFQFLIRDSRINLGQIFSPIRHSDPAKVISQAPIKFSD